MKKLVVLVLLFCLVGCSNDKFTLEEKYYGKTDYIELNVDGFNELVENKESFAVFIYQPLCSISYEFNKVLTEFSKTYKISFYKMAFSDMQETSLNNKIKYYPSLVIFKEGKVVDYLKADSDEDSKYYKDIEGFKSWFFSYVNETKANEVIDEEEVKNNIDINVKLDNVTYDENKVNIYVFWGDGCPHCEKLLKFLNSIEVEYGDYFKLNKFEVWYNEDNADLLNVFSNAMGDDVSYIPYIIIGNKSFIGFDSSDEKEILDAIKTQYKNSYDVYFDKVKN